MQTAVPTREKGDFVAVHPVRVVRPPRTIIYKKISPETYFPGPPGPPHTPPLEGVPLLKLKAKQDREKHDDRS